MKSVMRLVGCALLIAISLAAIRCSPPAPGRCIDDVRTAGVDDPGPEGFSARDLLDKVNGPTQGMLKWLPGPDLATSQPNSGMTGVTMELLYEGGEVQHVTSRPEVEDPDERLLCPNRIRIDAKLKLTTEDGSFNDIWDVKAVSQEGTLLGGVTLPDQGISGSYTVELVEPGRCETSGITLSVAFGESGGRGEISAWCNFKSETKYKESLAVVLAQWSTQPSPDAP